MDSMELDLLLGEQLAPPTQADLQQRALLQLLQPGADAGGAACAVQLAASLTAGMPQMYLHKLEPHPLAGMAADDEAPSRCAGVQACKSWCAHTRRQVLT